MAIIFALTVELERPEEALEFAQWLRLQDTTVVIDEYKIKMHPLDLTPMTFTGHTYHHVNVIPACVSYGLAWERHQSGLRLSSSQLSRLGQGLYQLIRDAPHYRMAIAGWETDRFLALDELSTDYAEDIKDGLLEGLVVSETLSQQLPKSSHWVPFDKSHLWIPYRGSKGYD
jgi:hypothetical protein